MSIVLGGGVTGCACALTLAEAGVRVRLHDARRSRAARAAATAASPCAALRCRTTSPRESLGRGRGAGAHGADRGGARPARGSSAGDAFRRVGSLRLADDEARARRARRRSSTRSRRTASLSSGSSELGAAARRALPRRDPAPADGALQPARWVRRLAGRAADGGRRDRRGQPASSSRGRARGRRGRRGDRRVHARRCFRSSADAVRATRGQMIATEPLPERRYERPHYARGRLRLLAAAAGRSARPRRTA